MTVAEEEGGEGRAAEGEDEEGAFRVKQDVIRATARGVETAEVEVEAMAEETIACVFLSFCSYTSSADPFPSSPLISAVVVPPRAPAPPLPAATPPPPPPAVPVPVPAPLLAAAPAHLPTPAPARRLPTLANAVAPLRGRDREAPRLLSSSGGGTKMEGGGGLRARRGGRGGVGGARALRGRRRVRGRGGGRRADGRRRRRGEIRRRRRRM